MLVVGSIMTTLIFFPLAMWIYHSQLVSLNLTTNEHLNLHKYDYLRPQRPYSPWDKGIVSNFIERLWLPPGEHLYVLPQHQKGLSDAQVLRAPLVTPQLDPNVV